MISLPKPPTAKECVIGGFLQGLEPPSKLSVTEWAEKEFTFSAEGSAEPGPYEPSRAPYQSEMMDVLYEDGVREVNYMTSAQVGKGLCLNTPIPTPSGWVTMGAIQAGDKLFDDQGAICEVTYASPVRNIRCYRVGFSDGSSIVCDEDHLWQVESDTCLDKLQEIGRSRRGNFREWGPKRTRGILGMREIAKFYRRSEHRTRFAVRLTQPLDLPGRSLPIEPYCLGAWLGDGTSRANSLSSGLEDLAHIVAQFESAGHSVATRRDRTCVCVMVDPQTSKSDTGPGRKGFGMSLSILGVRGNKHIPAIYLRSSHAQRLALLQGLMDTDGYAPKDKRGSCEFVTKHAALADGFAELLSSLGLKYHRTEKSTVCVIDGVRRPGARVARFAFKAYSDTPVFRLVRKQARLPGRNEGWRRTSETERVRISLVEEVDSVPTRCIMVNSASHLFLAGERMIPTHNTTALLINIGYAACHKPAPMMLIQPTLDMAKAFSQERLEPAIRDCAAMSEAFAALRSRSGDNTVLKKKFAGGQLTLAGANSAVSLRMRAVSKVFADEIDAYPASVDGEGDAVSLARKRTVTFGDQGRIACSSTPTLMQTSQIYKRFKSGDQRYWMVPCPECAEFQRLEWKCSENGQRPSNIHWASNDPETAEYECEHCGHLMDSLAIQRAVRAGHWEATQPFSGIVSFHLWEIYSPWRTLAQIVRDFLEAESSPTKMQTFWNTSLGLPWEGQVRATVEAKVLAERAYSFDPYALPEQAALVTAAVDVQHDRLEAMITAWGMHDERWILQWKRFPGDPNSSRAVWDQLREWLMQTFPHPTIRHPFTDRGEFPIEVVAIDSGYATQKVYDFCMRAISMGHLWWPIKGRSGQGLPIWSRSEVRLKNNVKLYIVGVDNAKAEIVSHYEVDKPGENYIHFNASQLNMSNFERMTNEKLIIDVDKKTGFTKFVWTLPDRKQNEDFDLMVYNLAARRSLAENTVEARFEEAYAPPVPRIDPAAIVAKLRGQKVEA